MNNLKSPFDKNTQPGAASRLIAKEIASQNEVDLAPSPDEVARHAYFTYLNQGSSNGHDVQHWLKAEAELTAERKITRTHGFHNRT